MVDKNSDVWHNLPLWLKWWFFFNYLSFRPSRNATSRIIIVSHISGFLFCAMGFFSVAALFGGLIMLTVGYLSHLLTWQGDKYGVWYDAIDGEMT